MSTKEGFSLFVFLFACQTKSHKGMIEKKQAPFSPGLAELQGLEKVAYTGDQANKTGYFQRQSFQGLIGNIAKNLM